MSDSDSSEAVVVPKPRRKVSVNVQVGQQDYPKSQCATWRPPVPIISEHEAVESFKTSWRQTKPTANGRDTDSEDELTRDDAMDSDSDNDDDIGIIDLDQFEIYRSQERGTESKKGEFIGLQSLVNYHTLNLCFNGIVVVAGVQRFLQAVTIESLSIEGYGDDEDPGVVLYLQSALCCRDKDPTYNVWYRLRTPSPCYTRFHQPFLRIAQLTKYTIEYIEAQPAQSVGLENFRSKFLEWLMLRFQEHQKKLRKWHQAFGSRHDLRQDVHAYKDFIHNQAYNLSSSLLRHPLWADCMVNGELVVKKQAQKLEYTVATPLVYKFFKDMYFGHVIEPLAPTEAVRVRINQRAKELEFLRFTADSNKVPNLCRPYANSAVQIGDVVVYDSQQHDNITWKQSSSDFLAYVHDVQWTKDGQQRLFVIWLYRPNDTNIFKAKYPYKYEFFFSDHCNCSDPPLLSSDIRGKCDIQWSSTNKAINLNKFFVRQTYVSLDSAFVTYQEHHKLCKCKTKEPTPTDNYAIGDTVYMTRRKDGDELLEPVIITQKDPNTVTVRKLLRLGRDCGNLAKKARRDKIAPNELVLTNEHEIVSTARIKRRCFIKILSKGQQVPFLESQGGSGDFWFLSMVLDHERKLRFLKELPRSMKVNHEQACLSQQLRGLSMFSGGGSLDRGLEEGGAVHFQHVVDYSSEAIHTLKANAPDPLRIKCFNGSVDDYIHGALKGKESDLVAKIGEVDVIAAGSPCPGKYRFSTLQQNILSKESLQNASHVSTFCSAVDIYRPKYAFLENVVAMAATRKVKEVADQNVLSQVVACLAGMGYQVHQFIMDAWNYGSCQQRSRIILCATAPGLKPIDPPPHTHSLPWKDTMGRSLGKLPNGENFGEREFYATPFTFVTAAEASVDLPNVGQGQVHACIPCPDHRLVRTMNGDYRALIPYIPRSPPGCGYKYAFDHGLIPEHIQMPGRDRGKAFQRIKGNGLVPTITTTPSVRDDRNGAQVHWHEDRGITLQEARRAQGWRDHEVIVGNLAEQWRIVGNGVDRKVSFALGVQLRRAVQAANPDFDTYAPARATHVVDPDRITIMERSSPVSIEDAIVVRIPQQTRVSQKFTSGSGLAGGPAHVPKTRTKSSVVEAGKNVRNASAQREKAKLHSPLKLGGRPIYAEDQKPFLTRVSKTNDDWMTNYDDTPPLDENMTAELQIATEISQEERDATVGAQEVVDGRSFGSLSITPSRDAVGHISPKQEHNNRSTSSRLKRSRPSSMKDGPDGSLRPNNEALPRTPKRPKTAESNGTIRMSTFVEDRTEIDTEMEMTNGGLATISTTTRHTRSTGATIDLSNVSWNKKPEKDF